MTQLSQEVIAAHALSIVQTAIDHPNAPPVLGRQVREVLDVLQADRFTRRERSHHIGALIGCLAGAAASVHRAGNAEG